MLRADQMHLERQSKLDVILASRERPLKAETECVVSETSVCDSASDAEAISSAAAIDTEIRSHSFDRYFAVLQIPEEGVLQY